jgi:hypothetical protein
MNILTFVQVASVGLALVLALVARFLETKS